MKRLIVYSLIVLFCFVDNICNAEYAEKKIGNIELVKHTKDQLDSAINASISQPRIIDDTIDDQDKIVGGVKATKVRFPWVVRIWRKKSLRPFCGGSLLNNRFVLVLNSTF